MVNSWGKIYGDAYYSINFNKGFLTSKNNSHIMLAQWQMWFWFWFFTLICLYSLMILRVIIKQNETKNPLLNSSGTSKGKWGDFLVAIIPLVWCGNILINSNFILRMIEWQNESSLFTIRIQGKQWYWCYKYNSDISYKLNNLYINVGHNNWYKYSTPSKQYFNYQNSTLYFIFEHEFKKFYFKKLSEKGRSNNSLNLNHYNNNIISSLDNNINNKNLFVFNNLNIFFKKLLIKNIKILNFNYDFLGYNYINNKNNNFIDYNYIDDKNDNFIDYNYIDDKNDNFIDSICISKENYDSLDNNCINNKNDNFYNYINYKKDDFYFNSLNNSDFKIEFFNRYNIIEEKDFLITTKNKYLKNSYYCNNFFINKKLSLFTKFKDLNWKNYFEEDSLEDVDETNENLRNQNFNFFLKITKGILNNHNISILNTYKNLNKNFFFNYQINSTNISEKISQVEQFWGFRQKKYKRIRSYKFNKIIKYHNKTYDFIKNYVDSEFNKYNLYASVKNNKYKNEFIPITLSKRLLRVKRTLVLPAHVNITLITSSYDVVHSWFVPGLGLKLDCVPGRSTHHTLYIDRVGIYFGQCAEICGRYHHHMPIRVAALSFEHFLLWWRHKGLSRMYRHEDIEKRSLLFEKFKY